MFVLFLKKWLQQKMQQLMQNPDQLQQMMAAMGMDNDPDAMDEMKAMMNDPAAMREIMNEFEYFVRD